MTEKATTQKRLNRLLKLYRQLVKQQEMLVIQAKSAFDKQSDQYSALETEFQKMNQRFSESSTDNFALLRPDTNDSIKHLETSMQEHHRQLLELKASWEQAQKTLAEQKTNVESLSEYCKREEQQLRSDQAHAENIESLDQILHRSKSIKESQQ